MVINEYFQNKTVDVVLMYLKYSFFLFTCKCVVTCWIHFDSMFRETQIYFKDYIRKFALKKMKKVCDVFYNKICIILFIFNYLLNIDVIHVWHCFMLYHQMLKAVALVSDSWESDRDEENETSRSNKIKKKKKRLKSREKKRLNKASLIRSKKKNKWS